MRRREMVNPFYSTEVRSGASKRKKTTLENCDNLKQDILREYLEHHQSNKVSGCLQLYKLREQIVTQNINRCMKYARAFTIE